MMFRYADDNTSDNISLHDCRATAAAVSEGLLTLTFDEGFYVRDSEGRSFYTDKSEVSFRTVGKNTEQHVVVYIFTDTGEENKSVREEISLSKLADMINGGMELEFISAYKGYLSYAFECWLWTHGEPHHRECVLIITADGAEYKWNELHPED